MLVDATSSYCGKEKVIRQDIQTFIKISIYQRTHEYIVSATRVSLANVIATLLEFR